MNSPTSKVDKQLTILSPLVEVTGRFIASEASTTKWGK